MSAALILPSWFKQRQAKAEPAGDHLYRLGGPNLGESFLSIRQSEDGKWRAALRPGASTDEITTEPIFDTEHDAWEAAFELYRNHVII
jgi:hypothetical protein